MRIIGFTFFFLYKIFMHRLQLSRNLWDSPGFLAAVPVPEGSTTIVLLVPDEGQTLA